LIPGRQKGRSAKATVGAVRAVMSVRKAASDSSVFFTVKLLVEVEVAP